jgi:subtilisin
LATILEQHAEADAVAEAEAEPLRRYIVVPADNEFNGRAKTTSFRLLSNLSKAATPGRRRLIVPDDAVGEVKVLGRVELNESTLVEMSQSQAEQLQRAFPSLRVAPEGILELFKVRAFRTALTGVSPAKGRRAVTIEVVDSAGKGVPRVSLDVLVDEGRNEVIRDLVTDADGRAQFSLSMRTKSLAKVAAAPFAGYWGATAEGLVLSGESPVLRMKLEAIAAGHSDAVSILTSAAQPTDGTDVRVAVIDSGASLPPGFPVVAGKNFVDGEDPDDVSDNGTGHGSHVAGIIHRLAPAATLRIYRVCGADEVLANELAISRAIRHAVDENCDLINISMGMDSEPLSISREIRRARAQGVVVIAATGNDWGGEVAWPARTASVLAVTACGDVTAAPKGAIAEDIKETPPSHQGTAFLARFSNYGPEVDFIAPGVAIVSNVSPDELGAMDGTSMAAPVMAGLVARLLSRDEALLNSEHTQQRSDDIVKACHKAAKVLGFGRDYEGSGMLRV